MVVQQLWFEILYAWFLSSNPNKNAAFAASGRLVHSIKEGSFENDSLIRTPCIFLFIWPDDPPLQRRVNCGADGILQKRN